MRVLWWQTNVHNESKGWLLSAEVGSLWVHHRPTISLRGQGLSLSIYVGTRKMVNYA